MLSNKKAALYVLAAALFGGSFTFFFLRSAMQRKFENDEINFLQQSENCDYNVFRLQGYKYIKPIVFAEKNCESQKYSKLKNDLTAAIEQFKQSNSLINASVYFRDFNQGDWITINGNETYNPGSLIKVPILITYLRMEEMKAGTLDMQFPFTSVDMKMPTQHFSDKEIQPSNVYSVRQLLRSMIINSDNNATYVLNQHINLQVFKKLFTDLGLPEPDEKSSTYPINAKQFSLFLKVLYNAGYLTINNSEYATDLLSQSEFGDGLVKGIPTKTPIAHKFGEAGNDEVHELHDAGIIYVNDAPYLLTVMTKGNDLKKLPEVISNISKIVFENMAVAK